MKIACLASPILAGVILLTQPAWPTGAAEQRHTISPHLFVGDDGGSIEAEWGRLIVPENRSVAGSNLIEVPFVRFRSSSPDPAVPLIFLNGGPGQESLGADIAQFLPFVENLPFDLILVEQRGVGYSRPRLDCANSYSLDPARPLDLARLRISERRHAQSCAKFWLDKGVDLTGYNAREMAADIDALRRALEYEKISLLGGSFGSHHGIAVLRYFGDNIHRAVLSAVEGPDHTIKLPSTIQRYLELLDEMAQADPDLSAQMPSFLGAMATVLEGLEKKPVTVMVANPGGTRDIAVTVGKLDLQLVTAAGLGRTGFLRSLPKRYHAMVNGDFSWLGKAALDYRTNRGGDLMGTLVDCASGASDSRRARVEEEAGNTLLGNAINGVQFDLCDVVGSADLGSEFRGELVTNVPILLVSAGLDPRTPASNVEEIQSGLAQSQHYILDGVSHDFDIGDERRPEYIQVQVQFFSGRSVNTTGMAVPFEFDRMSDGGE